MVNATSGKLKMQAGLLCASLALLLGGCDIAARPPPCPLRGQIGTVSVKLYFGRDIPGGGFVTDQAWSTFATTVLTPAFPDGFTTYEALGQWRNPKDGQIVRERSYVVETVGSTPPTSLATVVQAYRTTFHQVAVGEVSHPVCAAF